jgi:hypothetical protein
MRTLQRWLSDLLNPGSGAGAGLPFPDPADPERLWTWPALLGYMGLLGLLGWLFVSVA